MTKLFSFSCMPIISYAFLGKRISLPLDILLILSVFESAFNHSDLTVSLLWVSFADYFIDSKKLWPISYKMYMLTNPQPRLAQGKQTKNVQQTERETKDTNGLFGFCSSLKQPVF